MNHEVNDLMLTDLIIEEVNPLLVVVWTPGSQRWISMRPEVKELRKHYGDLATVVTINAIENPDFAREQLKVYSIPTTLLYLESDEVCRWEGPYTHQRIILDTKEHL